jgi:hypothetical protein
MPHEVMADVTAGSNHHVENPSAMTALSRFSPAAIHL